MTIEELEQQINVLQDEVDKLKSKHTKSEIKPWRADKNESYWFISVIGEWCETNEYQNKVDDMRYSFGNYYRTKGLAEQDRNEIALRNKIRQLRDVLCEGYEFIPDNNYNYTIYYNYNYASFCIDCYSNANIIGAIYFDTKEHAQQACNILNQELKNGNIKI